MSQRISYLDGLRGVLAVIVFLHHFFYIYFPELIFGGDYASFSNSGTFGALKVFALTPISILYNPGFAIHFFFLLSGYVQTKGYYQSGEAAGIQRSLLKRYFRLALPTLVVVVLVFCAHKFQFIHKEQVAANVLNADWLKSMLPNTLNFSQLFKEGLFSCFVHNSRYYQVLWTMPTELANSFLVLLLALAFNKLKHQTILTVSLLLVQFFVLQEYYSIAFVSGMLIARLQVQDIRFGVLFSKTWVKALCVVLGLYFGSYPFTGYQGAVANSIYAPISFFETYPHIISYFLGSTFLFLFLLHAPLLQKLLSRKLFLFYGRISFMLYLLHFLLLLSIVPSISQSTHNIALTLLLALLLVTALSWLFTKFVDEPVVKFCNWWAKLFA